MTDMNQLRLFDIEPLDAEYVYAAVRRMPLIKIGYTARSPRVRVAEQNADLIAFTFGGRADESALHRQLARFRIPGTELFYPSPEVYAVVAEMTKKPPLPLHD